MENEVKLGDQARDVVTGCMGIVTGKTEHLGGSAQVLLSPKIADDGEWREPRWIEIERIEVTATPGITL